MNTRRPACDILRKKARAFAILKIYAQTQMGKKEYATYCRIMRLITFVYKFYSGGFIHLSPTLV